jgi:hypothetical protein
MTGFEDFHEKKTTERTAGNRNIKKMEVFHSLPEEQG